MKQWAVLGLHWHYTSIRSSISYIAFLIPLPYLSRAMYHPMVCHSSSPTVVSTASYSLPMPVRVYVTSKEHARPKLTFTMDTHHRLWQQFLRILNFHGVIGMFMSSTGLEGLTLFSLLLIFTSTFSENHLRSSGSCISAPTLLPSFVNVTLTLVAPSLRLSSCSVVLSVLVQLVCQFKCKVPEGEKVTVTMNCTTRFLVS